MITRTQHAQTEQRDATTGTTGIEILPNTGDEYGPLVLVRHQPPGDTWGHILFSMMPAYRHQAAMFAAAPQMLQALKAASTLDSVSPDCEEVYNLIRDAIAAAEREIL